MNLSIFNIKKRVGVLFHCHYKIPRWLTYVGRVNNYNSSHFQHILGFKKKTNSDIVFFFQKLHCNSDGSCMYIIKCCGKRGLQTENGRTMLAVPHHSPHIHTLDVSIACLRNHGLVMFRNIN